MTATEKPRLCPVTHHPSPSGGDPKPVVDLDIHSQLFADNNYRIFRELEQCPVAWSTSLNGYWLLTGYEAVFDATRDDDTFISSRGTSVKALRGPDEENMGPIPIEIDPPALADYRKVASKLLSPASVAALDDELRQVAHELIDEFIESGEGDLVRGLSTPLPAIMILRVLGMDSSDWKTWVSLIHSCIHDEANGLAATTEIFTRVSTAITQRVESGDVGDDLLGKIISSEVNGAPMTFMEQVRYVFLALLGGMDTTSGLTGNTLVSLNGDPELRQRLIDDRDLLKQATEEFLRHGTPTQGLARMVSHDNVFHGQEMHEGERVALMWAAANRDPAEFDDPDEIDIDRNPNRHMAFGVGNHRCLGSNLARAMFRVMIDAILERLPDFEITVETVPRFHDAGAVYAPESLPVRFTPGPRIFSKTVDAVEV